MNHKSDRVRAWLFFRAENPDDATEKISSLFTEGGDDYVVVRADVAQGDFSLVVPVDAADDAMFAKAVGLLTQAVGSAPALEVRVLRHYPAEPQRAHCFVHPEEHARYPLHEYSPPGRHPKSPGANPWG